MNPAQSLDIESQIDSDAPSPRSETRRDIGRIALSLSDQLVVSGANFATLAMLANFFGMPKSQIGIFSLALTICDYLRTGQERMICNPYLVFSQRPNQSTERYLGSSMLFQSGYGFASCLVVLLIAIVFMVIGKPTGMAASLLVLSLAIPFLLLRDHVRAVSAAHYRFEVALAVDVVVAILQIGGLFALHYLGWMTIPSIIGVLGFACLVPTVGWWWFGKQPMEFDRTVHVSNWRESWGYSRWLVLARSIGIAGYFAIPWLVVFQLGEQQAGVYATCAKLVGLSLMFVTGANNFFQPRTVRAYNNDGLSAMTRSIIESIGVVGGVLLVVSAVFYVAGGWLMSLIFSESYAGYGQLVFLLSLSMVAVCVSIICGNGLAALAKPKGFFWGELSYCIVSISLAAALIPRLGLNGAAIGLIAGGIAASTVTALTLGYLIADRRNAGSKAGGELG